MGGYGPIMAMDQKRIERAREIFFDALEVPNEERVAFLDGRCGADEALRDTVERLLRADAVKTWEDPAAVVARPLLAEERPDRIGPFRILRELGRGGMGVVYLAEQETPRREVALKTLLPGRASERACSLFLREAHALAQVVHPGIPQVHQVVEDGSRIAIAMELVQGRPLTEVASEMTREDLLELLARAADAVDAAHLRGLVHRDLKPDNIMVTSDFRPKVIDFGISKFRGGEARGSGTLKYMPPEQLRSEATDFRADVYSFGAMSWELFTGSLPHPFRGEDRATLAAIRVRPPAAPPLDRALAAVLLRAVAPNPDDRHPSMAALAEDLRRVVDRRVVSPLIHSPRALLVSVWYRRRGAVVLALSSAVVAMAGVAGWNMWSAGAERARVELRATEELDDLKRRTVEAGSEDPGVREAVSSFLRDPAYDGTRALSAGWLWWGRTGAASGPAAFTQSWATAPDEPSAAPALEELVEHFAWNGDWGALDASLSARPPTAHVGERQQMALALWDVRGAHGFEPHPVLAALTAAKEWPAGTVSACIDGPQDFVAVDGSHRLVATRQGLAVGLDGEFELSGRTPGSCAFVRARGEMGLLRLGGSNPATLLEVDPDINPRGSWVVDLFGDGRRSRFSTVWDGRGSVVRAMDLDGPGDLLRGAVSVHSVPHGIGFADFDGDGELEMVTGTLGWRARDLRLLDGVAGEPHILSRARVGVRALTTYRHGSGEGVVMLARPVDRAPVVPSGEKGTLYLLPVAVTAGEFVLGEPAALPKHLGSGVRPADLDGDGLDELVVYGEHALEIHTVDAAGQLSETWRLPGLTLVGIGQMDEDPADELWVRAPEEERAWILGAPGPGLPMRAGSFQQEARPAPDGLRQDRARAWRRAESLVDVGLLDAAVTRFRDLGSRPGNEGTAALTRALELATDPSVRADVARALRLDQLRSSASAHLRGIGGEQWVC